MTAISDPQVTTTGGVPQAPIPFPTRPAAAVIREQAIAVQGARQILAARQAAIKASRQQWERDNAEMLQAVENAKADLVVKEHELRELTLEAYTHTHDKSPGPGVGIRETKTYTYDEGRVKAWAINHRHATLLMVDEIAVKRVGEAMKIPTFEVGAVVQATIAADLGKALELAS